MKYILSLCLLMLVMGCETVPLTYRLQYSYTSEERDSLESRISKDVKKLYEGSALRQSKLDTLIALNDEEEEYYRQKSFKFTRVGEFEEGRRLIDKAVQLDPLNALYFTSWQLLFNYRDYEGALADLEYYDDISEGVSYVWGDNVNYLKGLCYKQMGLYDQAVEEFDACIDFEADKVSEYVYVYRGISNLRHECIDEAKKDFKMALAIDNRCTMAYVYMGEALLLSESCHEAMTYLQKAEDLLCRGAKKTHPYFEVFDEVYLDQVYDLIAQLGSESEVQFF